MASPKVNIVEANQSQSISNSTIRQEASRQLQLGSEGIIVRVGAEGSDIRDFLVHAQLIRDASPFFDAALKHEWQESTERMVKLPEETPESFEVYMQWLYTHRIFSQKEGDAAEEGKDEEWHRLGLCYVLGDRLQDVDFKDATLDALVDKIESMSLIPTGLHTIIYPKTTSASPARRLLVDIAIWEWMDEAFEKKLPTSPHDFAVDLSTKLATFRKGGRSGEVPYRTNTCLYHEHTKLNKPCYRTKLNH